ncbi:MAG: O-acetyl-ADP-ribose deacetylase [Gammaproteobacteria bacterium]|jgi:O-acetyl-ADP-ribose deacetylase (regulator of RNase III)|nr:O-acetyl-ADP-ribose deacetylase [Gammaproteobacteria bacterium]
MAQIEIRQADITRLQVDAIVNAANTELSAGAGVCGAIHQAAGPELLDECHSLGGCATGEAKLTGGYRLPAGHVIHAVGPVWRGGDQGEDRLLANCYRNSIRLAEQQHLNSIAFPAISCGIYGYPLDAAASIAIESTLLALGDCDHLDQVTFACFGDDVEKALQKALAQHAL